MNNIFFVDGDEAPQTRDQVVIKDIVAEPYPDGSRVRIQIGLTPFLEKPNLEIYAQKVDGPIVAEMSVIETMTPHLEFTLHIRGVTELTGKYQLRAELYYDDRQQPQHSKTILFTIEAPAQ